MGNQGSVNRRRMGWALLSIGVLALPTLSWSYNGIVKPYQSVRSAGWGGVRMTTGLYDENFFNNPARASANPESKTTIFQWTPIEINTDTISDASQFGSTQSAVKQLISDQVHSRSQLIMPAFYWAAGEKKTAVAAGLLASAQVDGHIQSSADTDLQGLLDIGPAVTVAQKYLKDDALSVGITGHLIYRVSAIPSINLFDYFLGSANLGISGAGGQGTMLDFDLGSTYRFLTLGEFNFDAGAAIQNSLGGNYSNLPIRPIGSISNYPPPQPRSLGLGVAAVRELWGPLIKTTFALELTDIGNNANGSFFKLLHMGGETHWRQFAVRLGLNQGYWTAGLGVDLHWFTMDVASYGEEASLLVGGIEDRRYTLNVGFHI